MSGLAGKNTESFGVQPDVYCNDDGMFDTAWVPFETRAKARALVASIWDGDYVRLGAWRCWLRAATEEECRSHGWDYGVIECQQSDDGAVPGWKVCEA